MLENDKIQLIKHFLTFSASSFVCGIIFYLFTGGLNFYKNIELLKNVGIFYLIINLLILFVIFKFSSVLSKVIESDYGKKTIGLHAENFIGLLVLSVCCLFIFNPFYTIFEMFPTNSGDDTNRGFTLILGVLVMGTFLLYSSKRQIESLLPK